MNQVPSDPVLTAWAPACDLDTEHYQRLADLARTSDGPVPTWFEYWLERERTAHMLRVCSPVIMPAAVRDSQSTGALSSWPVATTRSVQMNSSRRL